MKILVRSVLAGMFSLGLGVAHGAAIPISPVPSTSSVSVLGGGYIEDQDKMTGTVCLNGTKSNDGSPSGTVNFTYVDSFQQLKTHLDLNFNASVGKEFFAADDKTRFVFDAASDDYTAAYVYRSSFTLRNEVFTPSGSAASPLNALGLSLLNNGPLFKSTCGTKFVHDRVVGGELYMAVKFSFYNSAAKAEFHQEFNSRITSIGGLQDKLGVIAEKYKNRLSISVIAYQLGGNPAGMGKIFQTSSTGGLQVQSCSLETIDSCRKAISGMLSYAGTPFADQFSVTDPNSSYGPAILSYVFRDYQNAGVIPPAESILTQAILEARIKLANEFEKQTLDLVRANNVLSRFAGVISYDQEQKIRALLPKLQANVQTLRTAGENCFNDPASCVMTKDTALKNLYTYDRSVLIINIVTLVNPVTTRLGSSPATDPSLTCNLPYGWVLTGAGAANNAFLKTRAIQLEGREILPDNKLGPRTIFRCGNTGLNITNFVSVPDGNVATGIGIGLKTTGMDYVFAYISNISINYRAYIPSTRTLGATLSSKSFASKSSYPLNINFVPENYSLNQSKTLLTGFGFTGVPKSLKTLWANTYEMK